MEFILKSLTWIFLISSIVVPFILAYSWSKNYQVKDRTVRPCRNCGAQVKITKKYCPNCNIKYPVDTRGIIRGIKYRGKVFFKVYLFTFLTFVIAMFCTAAMLSAYNG